MEYFDDAWYKCRTGRDDMLHTRITALVELGCVCVCVGGGGGEGAGTFFFFFFLKTFSSFCNSKLVRSISLKELKTNI